MVKHVHIWKINEERLYIFGKLSFLDLEPLTMIQTLFCFSPLMILWTEVFVNVWLSLNKFIGEFQIVHKNWVLWYNLGSIIVIVTCNICVTPQHLFTCSGCASHFLFTCVLGYSNQLRNGIFWTCASADCVPLSLKRNQHQDNALLTTSVHQFKRKNYEN